MRVKLTKMDILPDAMIHEILMFLSVSDLYVNWTLVNKNWNAMAYQNYVLNWAVARELHLPKFSAPPEDCIMILSNNHANAKPSKKYIPFRGIGTTGGVDSMIPHYWVTNMFAPSGSFYCSEDSVDNIVVMAILESWIAPRQVDEAYQTALKRGAEILRSCTALTQLIRLSQHERSEFERPELTSFT